ncbi:ATP-binding cassette domain-containing protein [Microbacterium sp. M3]|uniref:ATP-binding cassette domain-containing protein n=1 Tax=Microbacterium arthrosphaerae TaxID=792652 RepID=A0ABU4H548_9MICO|nr:MULTISPECIES: ATP-binding cassette domain-containing protein [Microbacterium]MDW4574350.1 ATP-binding cassette domain-containing protein [Microbacterium arthrosphaerae]MDW7608205.1 ATP-binding cassette domain-containing protein [Microbacterium sp. M3]
MPVSPAVPLLRVSELGVTHDGEETPAPASVSFTVAPGEVVLLLGPSGSGKSTLTLALNGLIPHAVPATVTGTVEVDGLDTRDTPVAALSTRVGMVFQDPDAQLVTGTLLDEVAFGPENLRMPVADVLARAEAALRRVGLWDRRAENPDRLSGGGRQRLAIACALAMGSPLLVLDEPTANLDPAGIEEVYAALGDLVAAGDRAILLVEHNLDAAVGFVDRVVVLDHDGRLAADGTVDDVLRGRAGDLHEMGVWLPVSAIAALRLRQAGFTLDPLPLTPDELRAALDAEPAPAGLAKAEPASARLADAEPASRSSSERSGTQRSEPTHDADSTPELAHRDEAAPLITVRDLFLRRGRAEVLHGIDLAVPRGAFVAVVGANGAGKTTLIQALAGVVTPPKGSVHIDGLDVGRSDARTLSRRVGFVFQNPEHQFIAHTVFDEIAHGLRLQHLPDDKVRTRTEALLERFGLTAKAGSHPFLLSGGQKRRLSVGTALVAGAPVLVLDEPTFGQDRARADELLSLLAELNADGTTIVVVTHDMQLVTDYADRTVVMADGRVLADGPTADIFADDALIARAGLRPPPLRRALRGVQRHPELSRVARLADLPGAPVTAASSAQLHKTVAESRETADVTPSSSESVEFSRRPHATPHARGGAA